MNNRPIANKSSLRNQSGVSLLVVMVMLLVLTLVGVSSMNTAVVELKMAGSMQQQGVALNRAEELLSTAEGDLEDIVDDATKFDFNADGDAYYGPDEALDIHDIDWEDQGFMTQAGPNTGDEFVTQYLGQKAIPGESVKISTDGRIIGGYVFTFRNTTRSEAGKNAVRIVQSIYVTDIEP
jgi:type IV pilus assembly protein PilX